MEDKLFINTASKSHPMFANQNEHDCRTVLDGIRDHAIIRTDLEGNIVDWNIGAENIFGWTKDEVLERDASLIFTPEDLAKRAVEKEMEISVRNGKAEDKRWHVKKDGSRFYANGIMNSLLNEDGNVIGYIKVLRDDTERAKLEVEKIHAQNIAEAAQKTTESTLRQFHDFFIQSPTPMVIIEGPEYFIKLANAPYEKLVKRKVTGKTVLEAFSKEEVKEFIPLLDSVYKTGKPFIGKELPLNISNDNGENENLWLNFSYFPHFDENGEIKGILCDVHDVTELVNSRREIQESADQFKTLANSLPMIIWTATPDGYVDWYNDWWYKYLNLPYGAKWDDQDTTPMHPDDVIKTIPIWKESTSTGKPYYIEQRFKRGSDGIYRWHLVRGVAIKNEEGEITKWIGANVDIQDHKDFVHTLEEERELRERFVAALSHDLRTPITSAKLSAQTLRRSYFTDDKILRASDRIVANLDRIDYMIQDLLDANSLSVGEKIPIHPEVCDLTDIVHITLEELRHIHGNRFEIVEDKSHIKGNWDLSALRRIIENLCNNAIKYGDGETPIIVHLGSYSKGKAFLSVNNKGKPIESNELKKLFKPYGRTSNAQASGKKGWGIGLMLVKGLVTAHEGSIEVESTESEGTTFTVKLPTK